MSTDPSRNPDFDDFFALCNTCGAELDWVDCFSCGGEGGRDEDELMMDDPLWYEGFEWERCDSCNGEGGYLVCPALPHKERAK